MKLYISGGISGVPDYKSKFAAARKKLECAGYAIENPAEYDFPADVKWETAMKYDLCRLLECDGVALLDGWEFSRGACYEAGLATDLAIKTKSINDWITEAQNDLHGN